VDVPDFLVESVNDVQGFQSQNKPPLDSEQRSVKIVEARVEQPISGTSL
jgi:hypothetical protein